MFENLNRLGLSPNESPIGDSAHTAIISQNEMFVFGKPHIRESSVIFSCKLLNSFFIYL